MAFPSVTRTRQNSSEGNCKKLQSARLVSIGGYMALMPPSSTSSAPVMNLDSSDAR
jgi:hypothetical protein